MKSKEMKELMIMVLKLALKKYNFELIHYTIMDNHFHFFIRTLKDGEDIARIMQFIKSQYARRFNRSMNRIGPFWNERYKDIIIELTQNPVYTFFWILWKIGYNPVDHGYTKNPWDYKYSSFKCYLDDTYIPPVKITLHKFFLDLGYTFNDCIRKFLSYEKIFI
jgi:REP element-mobilizing transposase RayT